MTTVSPPGDLNADNYERGGRVAGDRPWPWWLGGGGITGWNVTLVQPQQQQHDTAARGPDNINNNIVRRKQVWSRWSHTPAAINT